MSPFLLGSVVSLLAWAVLLFATPVTAGAIHLLLAASSTLFVAWWARRT